MWPVDLSAGDVELPFAAVSLRVDLPGLIRFRSLLGLDRVVMCREADYVLCAVTKVYAEGTTAGGIHAFLALAPHQRKAFAAGLAAAPEGPAGG